MWYSAALLFQSVHNRCPTRDDVWELQVIVIQASSEDAAKGIAKEIGKQNEVEYISATGDLVQWVFRRVESITELSCAIEHGTEVYGRFLHAADEEHVFTPFDDVHDEGPAIGG
jgi:hypothetical protein